MKCFVILVVIEATGIVIRGLKRNLETVLGKHLVESTKKKKKSSTRDITHNKESAAV
jgi:hypothetical protein